MISTYVLRVLTEKFSVMRGVICVAFTYDSLFLERKVGSTMLFHIRSALIEIFSPIDKIVLKDVAVINSEGSYCLEEGGRGE